MGLGFEVWGIGSEISVVAGEFAVIFFSGLRPIYKQNSDPKTQTSKPKTQLINTHIAVTKNHYFCEMIAQAILPRILQPTDWATIVFVLCFALVAVARTAFEKRFADFARLLISDKYIKVYKDPSHLMSGFTVVLFLVQVLSLAFFIQLTLAHYNYAEKTDWVLFIRISTLLGVFILSKFLIDKIIGTAFNMDEFVEQFNLRKVSYRSYIALVLLPVNIVLFYSDKSPEFLFFVLITAILLTNLLTYLVALKNYQNFITGKLFYFILYLCALEIAPYYFMYYWFTKS
jgi:hypothetical protein